MLFKDTAYFTQNSKILHQKKQIQEHVSSTISEGKPIYTANLTVDASAIKVEILNPLDFLSKPFL